MALGVGVPLILTCVGFTGTIAAVLVIKRKKGKWCE